MVSCTAKKQSEEQIQQYMHTPSNGLIQEDSINGIKISVQNKPVALIVAQELRGAEVVNDSIQEAVQKQFADNLYFNLNLSIGDKDPLLYSGNLSNFSSMLQTMAFQMDQFVFLTTSDKDTIPVADFIYPRMYGMGAGSSIMFAFSKEKIKARGHDPEKISFHLLDFGMNTGNRKYEFEMEDIQDVPALLVVPKE